MSCGLYLRHFLAALLVCLSDGQPDILPFGILTLLLTCHWVSVHLSYSHSADVGIKAQLTSKLCLLPLSGCFILLCKQTSLCWCGICKELSFLPQHSVGSCLLCSFWKGMRDDTGISPRLQGCSQEAAPSLPEYRSLRNSSSSLWLCRNEMKSASIKS